MRADLRALRASQRLIRIPTGPGCRMCGREDIGKGVELCGRCRREYRPTPLDLVLVTMGLSPRAFADLTDMPLRTVLRAAKGERMSARVARRLSDITGFPPKVFRP